MYYELNDLLSREDNIISLVSSSNPYVYKVFSQGIDYTFLVVNVMYFSSYESAASLDGDLEILNPRHTYFLSDIEFDEFESGTEVEETIEDSEEQLTMAKQLLYSVISQGKQKGASDIHFVREESKANVYYRIDGNKQLISTLKGDKCDAAMSVFYNVEATSKGSNWNRTVPQDAMGSVPSETGQMINLRYAHAPVKTKSEKGYHAVFRILQEGNTGTIKDLSSLGFTEGEVQLIKKMVSRPYGLLIVAGTTGSGKSTTIRGFLEWLSETFHNNSITVLTVEDPVEYDIRGAVQSNVKRSERDTDNPFMKYIYSAMRRDPDVLLVGETRDPATASALTDVVESGHLGVTTLHASSVVGVVARLNSLGIAMEKLRSIDFWAGIIIQKLIRRTCPKCCLTAKKAYDAKMLSNGFIKYLAKHGSKKVRVASASGCEFCGNSGYKGRQICAEFLYPTPNIIKNFDSPDILEIWQSESDGITGKKMSDRALELVIEGKLCPCEYERVFGVI